MLLMSLFRVGFVIIVLRVFVVGCMFYVCDVVLDDYVLFGVVKLFVCECLMIDDDVWFCEVFGDDYVDDGAWWKSTVSRGG